MNVFLPYADFAKSTACLDPKRLGNQIYRECYTLIRGGWPNHPAAKIWANYKKALAQYCLAGLEELSKRGRHYPKWIQYYESVNKSAPDTGLPKCVGNEAFHASHRSNLLKKDFAWYGRFGWAEPADLPYVWTVE